MGASLSGLFLKWLHDSLIMTMVVAPGLPLVRAIVVTAANRMPTAMISAGVSSPLVGQEVKAEQQAFVGTAAIARIGTASTFSHQKSSIVGMGTT